MNNDLKKLMIDSHSSSNSLKLENVNKYFKEKGAEVAKLIEEKALKKLTLII